MSEIAKASVDIMRCDCVHCEGEGCVLELGRPGVFSVRAGAYGPSERLYRCPHCDGSGEVEVCARCRQPLEIREGREVCGCAALELPQAA